MMKVLIMVMNRYEMHLCQDVYPKIHSNSNRIEIVLNICESTLKISESEMRPTKIFKNDIRSEI